MVPGAAARPRPRPARGSSAEAAVTAAAAGHLRLPGDVRPAFPGAPAAELGRAVPGQSSCPLVGLLLRDAGSGHGPGRRGAWCTETPGLGAAVRTRRRVRRRL